MSNRITGNITFHNVATEAADGNVLNVGSNNFVTIEVDAASTFSISFEGACNSEVYFPVLGKSMTAGTSATTATSDATLYLVDLTGLTHFRCKLTAAGGEVSVYGTTFI